MPTIILLTSDLMITSRAEGAAASAGSTLEPAATLDAALAACASGDVALILIDLSSPGLDINLVTAELRQQTPAPIVAFAPHVHAEKLAAAGSAGCNEVLTRGQFHGQLEAIVSKYVNSGERWT